MDEQRTEVRLKQIAELGMTLCGVAQWGIEGIMSGLYIERIWNDSKEEWDSYLEWVKDLKNRR